MPPQALSAGRGEHREQPKDPQGTGTETFPKCFPVAFIMLGTKSGVEGLGPPSRAMGGHSWEGGEELRQQEGAAGLGRGRRPQTGCPVAAAPGSAVTSAAPWVYNTRP